MEITFEQYERVQKYLDNEMPVEERKEFELLLHSDPDLQAYVNFEQELHNELLAIKTKNEIIKSVISATTNTSSIEGYAHMRSLISKTHKDLVEQTKKRANSALEEMELKRTETVKQANKLIKPNFSFKLLVAASFIIAISAAILWFYYRDDKNSIVQSNNKNDQTSDIVQNKDKINTSNNDSNGVKESPINKERNIEYGVVYKNAYRKDTSSFEIPGMLSSLPEAYRDSNYTAILSLDLDNLPVIMGTDEVNSEQNILAIGYYYKGLALMETNEHQSAILSFQWVIKNSKNVWLMNRSKWYAALAYLKLNDPNKALPLFESLTKSTAATPYNAEAKKILTTLTGKNFQ